MSSAAVTQTVFSPSVIVLNFNLSRTRCVWFVVNSSFSGNCKAIERGSYVTAGYGRHRGECGLLLLLPTLLFHLIIWPPCWLKACCMVTWWLSHPHCCQMKALSCVIKLGKPLRNHKKKINLISIKLPTTAISILQPDFDTLKAKMRLMQSVKRKCGRLWDYVNIILKRNLEKRMFHGEPNLTFKFQGLERGTAP